ncbi:MAG: hypothetical protein ACR2QO_00660 [Acidimicrobiales bacterium]
MAEMQDSWKEVSSKAEALGLKLKVHLEQEAEGDDESTEEGSTRATLEDFGRKLQDAFDSLGVAAKDPAVQADFKDMGALVKDAIADTFSSVSTDVGDAMKKATRRGDDAAADDSPSDPAEEANGDVTDSSDTADDT